MAPKRSITPAPGDSLAADELVVLARVANLRTAGLSWPRVLSTLRCECF